MQPRSIRNSQCVGLSTQFRSSLTPIRCSTTIFSTSTHVISTFRPLGSGAESISTHAVQNLHKICAKPTKNSTAIKTIHDYPDNTSLYYVHDTQGISENPPDPDPRNGGDDGDPPDNFDNDKPDNDKPQNANDRFLQVMSNLAAGIRALHLPAPWTDKVKVREPNTFDGTDPRKLQDFLVSCNLYFRDRCHT